LKGTRNLDYIHDPYDSNLGRYGNWGGKFNFFRKKRVIRTVTALVLFFLILGISMLDSPFALAVREKLAFYLIDEQSDWSPYIAEAVRKGIWIDTFEKGVMETFMQKKGSSITGSGETMSIPVSGSITREFGWENTPDGNRLLHPGIDILAAKPNATVRAAMDGKVRYLGENQRLGKFVEIDHGQGLVTVYGNCTEILVSEGQRVKRGDAVAKLGSQPRAYLHFEVRINGEAIDPMGKLTDSNDEI